MYKYINKKEEFEKLSNITDKLLNETSNINEKTLNNVQKLREEMSLMRFKPTSAQKNNTQEQKWIWPVESKIISSGYGYRIHPIHKDRRFHKGIDIAESNNKPVWAVADGKVIKAQWNGDYGNYIEIDHGNGLISFYGHLNSYNVKAGDYVTQGQVIGNVGSTGSSTGNHLHFGVLKDNKNDNPLKYLPKTNN